MSVQIYTFLKCTLERVTENTENNMIVPSGTISVHFSDEVIFVLAGDLINMFDALFSESLRVILQSQTIGHIYSSEAPGALSLSLDDKRQLKVDLFDDLIRLEKKSVSYSYRVDPAHWLSQIASEFRLFQKNPQIGKETILRHKRGSTIPLLEVLM